MTQNNNIVKNNKRSSHWAFIAYPESIKSDWINILSNKFCLCWAKSPLHDKDINENKEIKKAHWHCIIIFSSLKSFSQVKEITDEINATNPQIIYDLNSYTRYLAHLDNEDKYKYDINKIDCFNGFNLEKYLYSSLEDKEELKLQILDEILEYIDKNEITEFYFLINYARKEKKEWIKFLCKNSINMFINNYIKSLRHLNIKREMI